MLFRSDYGFSYAVVWYGPFANGPALPYIVHLEADPKWALVYADDRSAVYLKKTPDNLATIARHQYFLVKPLDLYSSGVLQRTPRAQLAQLEQELIRLAAADANSIQARLLLAQIYIQVYRHDDALTQIRAGMATEPRSYRPHELMAALLVKQEKWADAGRELETAMDLAGGTGGNYGYLADVFEKAGDHAKAAQYRGMR